MAWDVCVHEHKAPCGPGQNQKRNEVREGAAVGRGLALPAWLFSFGNSEKSNNSKPNPAFQIIMKACCVDVDRRERSFQ